MKRIGIGIGVGVVLLAVSVGLIFFRINGFSKIEKIALLEIPRSAKLIEKKVFSSDFDGSQESFFVLTLDTEEYSKILRQCEAQNYKSTPIPNLDISYMDKYIRVSDTVIYKLRNVNPPDYDLVVLNLSSRTLIIKQVKLYR